WRLRGREDEIEYANQYRIPVEGKRGKLYSRDRNIWHLSHEGGPLEDPWWEPEESLFQLTVSPEEAPNEPTYIELGFEKGTPVSLDGARLGPVELLTRLNEIGGANAIGRVDLVENRLVGMKSRGVYETPGGTIIIAAHRELEGLTLDREALHYKALVAQRNAELVYYGQWFTPLRESLDCFVDQTQERVTGTVRLKLYKGNLIVAGRQSPYSLYSQAFASFEQEEVYNQKDAQGFINLFGLPITVRALLDIEREGKSSYL
ncbi:MAG: argininosuccinate synthase, partial [Chloroflexota bacterium]|nr:argininosuccinate synthase [Chloroflexota bacterium]